MAKNGSQAQTRYRSAKTGQYTTKRYAKTHPSTTVKETDRKKKC